MAASTVTKQDVIAHVSAKTQLPHQRATEVVQQTFDTIVDFLAQGKRIEVRNFGVFDVRVKRARMGRILATMQPVEIPSRAVVRFKPGKEMRQIVAERATAILSTPAAGTQPSAAAPTPPPAA